VRTVESKREKGAGFGLVEVTIAMAVLLVGLGAMLNLFLMAAGLSANQGETAKRVTEYAQDKMEQLLSLDFLDSTSDTSVYPISATGGTGLGGALAASTTLPTGGIDPASPATGYVDYLDASGSLVGAGASTALYVRQWSISTGSSTTIKTVTVTVRAMRSMGPGKAPSITIVSYKSSQS
jgi:hypothetical protein